jgi:hypothetical protein
MTSDILYAPLNDRSFIRRYCKSYQEHQAAFRDLMGLSRELDILWDELSDEDKYFIRHATEEELKAIANES